MTLPCRTCRHGVYFVNALLACDEGSIELTVRETPRSDLNVATGSTYGVFGPPESPCPGYVLRDDASGVDLTPRAG